MFETAFDLLGNMNARNHVLRDRSSCPGFVIYSWSVEDAVSGLDDIVWSCGGELDGKWFVLFERIVRFASHQSRSEYLKSQLWLDSDINSEGLPLNSSCPVRSRGISVRI
jgi:hypothetical protein